MSELGTLLVRAREARGLTLEDAERDTRISRRYLQALESEQFEAIPAPVYARGFLRSYSQYLGLDPQDMLDRFPRDADDAPPYRRDVTQRASPENPISATSASRPSWRRPSTSRSSHQPGGERPPSQEPLHPDEPRHAGYVGGPDDVGDSYGARRAERPRQDARDVARRLYEERHGRGSRYNDREDIEQLIDERDAVNSRYDELDDSRTPIPRSAPRRQSAGEPMIGVDIGVPAPARRIRTDPAAQTRTLAVVAVAIGAIIVVIVIALLLSRAGSSAAGLPSTTETTTTLQGTSSAAAATTPVPATATPTSTVAPGSQVAVPDVLNLQRSQAETAIKQAGLEVSILEQSATQPQGTVIDQAPAPGSNALAGDTVHLVISTGQ